MPAMDTLIHVVPNILQPIIILFHFLPGLMRNSTYLYRVRGVEVSIGAMGYTYNGMQAHPKADWQYDLPRNIHESIPPLKQTLFMHFIAALLLSVWWLIYLVMEVRVAYLKKKDGDRGASLEFRVFEYQKWWRLFYVFPGLIILASIIVDPIFISRAMALNKGLPKGVPKIFEIQAFGVLILVAHGLSGLWGVWIAGVSYHYHNADEKDRSRAWDRYHKGLEKDGYNIDDLVEREKQRLKEKQKLKEKSRSSKRR